MALHLPFQPLTESKRELNPESIPGSPLIVIHELQHDDRQNSEEHHEEGEMCPAAEDIGLRQLVGGFLHGFSALDKDLIELALLFNEPQGFLDLFTAVAQLEDRIPQRDGPQGVVVALRT